MDKTIKDGIEQAKALIRKMQNMRDSSMPARYVPSPIWRDVLLMTDYLFRLSADDFLQIRYHCDLFTGRDLIRYLHSCPAPDPQTDMRARMYRICTSELPDEFRLGEPKCQALPFVPGVDVEGRIVNGSVVRFQLCASYLYHSGIARALSEERSKCAVVEVGGGYGGMAHGLFHAFRQNICCVMVDFPEMLLFQIPFIMINNPGCRCYVYDEATFTPEFIRNQLGEYDFVFLPNFALPALRKMPRIKLLLNLISFQEMTPEQVEEYLDFAQNCTEFGLYSDNYDCHPYNTSGLGSITDRLETRFRLSPDPRSYWDQRSPRGKIENYGQFRRMLALNPHSSISLSSAAEDKLIGMEEGIRLLHATK